MSIRKTIIGLTAVATLAVPAIASADPVATGVSTNAPAAATIGYDVSAGNYNYLNGVVPGSTGSNRSSFAGTPGAVAAMIANARATTTTGYAGPFLPPGQ
jgi:phage-related minor tail protein